MKGIKKVSKLVLEVDGKFVRSDGFPSDPLNTRRTVNTSKLCDDILEAKNFDFFREDLPVTMKAFPNARIFRYNLGIAFDRQETRV